MKTAHIVGRLQRGDVRRKSDQGSLLDQAGHDPVLGLGDRPALGDLDGVAEMVVTVLVVRVVLARLGHDLAVELVLHTTLDQHGHGLGALVADHLADQGALEGFFSGRCTPNTRRHID